jgi:hypothetical protein
LFDNDYLERCRHNQRFTELFSVLSGTEHAYQFEVASPYEEAFITMQEQMSNDIGEGQSTPVSQVACAVFAKILSVEPNSIHNGVVLPRDCSAGLLGKSLYRRLRAQRARNR